MRLKSSCLTGDGSVVARAKLAQSSCVRYRTVQTGVDTIYWASGQLELEATSVQYTLLATSQFKALLGLAL